MKLPTFPSPATWSRRERVMAAAGALVLVVMAMDRFVLGPWWRHTQHIQQEIGRLEEAIRAHQQLLARRPAVMAEAAGYGEAFRGSEQPTPDMAAALRELESLGTQSGIQVGEIKPGSVTAEGGMVLDVQYTGSFQSWVHFIYLLQTSPTLFEIERAAVAMDDLETATLKGSVRLVSHLITPAS